jgi:bifunctional DNA-binding transcriptional regulator/antitoxin component of YhaV-PrlF toxin-antitoxin module
MRFHGVIELGGRTATGIEVPEDVVTGLNAGRRPPVSVTIGAYTYRSTVASRDGRFLIPVSAEVRRGAGVQAGDEVDVELVLDTAPRVVTVPADLAEALDADPPARKAFDGMSYSHQRQYVLAVEDAKTPATRQRRIDSTITKLRG